MIPSSPSPEDQGLVCSNGNKQAWTAHPTVTLSCRLRPGHGAWFP
ncbi:hypothetical protein SynRS9909_01327 [Synechococcus sp. RS9909]|nr:hypothetical protein SynRS9909_01327 [Synechococcus sp. RS9909]